VTLDISTIVSSVPAEFSVTEGGPLSILPGDSAKIHVTFHPTGEAAKSANLVFTHDGLTSPNNVSLSGNGVAAHFTAAPGSLSFGLVFVTSSKEDSVQVGNTTGTGALTISSLVPSTPSEFSVTEAGPVVVPPGGSVWIHVTFHPTASGLQEGRVTFTHNGSTSPDTVHVEGTGYQTVNVNVSLSTGWNMISNPVTASNDSVRVLYPTSVNAYAYSFSGGYVQDYTMENGTGYWQKFPSATSQAVTGLPRTRDSISVAAGWNMVGTISNTVDTSTIVSVPSGLRASVWYGFNAGYTAVTQLIPGSAYWVKASAAGKFVLANPLVAGPAKVQSPDGKALREVLNTVTITDSRGGSQTLYFGADANTEVPVALYDMPPIPPVGAFDARFSTGEGGSMVRTHTLRVSDALEFPVTTQSDAYPLTVRWNVSKGTASYEMADGMNGQVFRAKEMRGEGSIKITNSGLSRFSIRLVGDGQLPKEYALSQNYPNPFNPTTSLRYALPVDSRVTMEIYNVLGQRVRTLVSENVVAGYHIAEWNGMGSEGQQLGSGTYFLKLSAAGVNGAKYTQVRKLLMLK
jgi:hypothetical protein